MKLRSKHNVSNTVIQAIIEEYSHLTSETMSSVEAEIKSLTGDVISEDLCNSILQAVRSNSLSAVLNLKVGPMRSEHSRKAYYKEAFNFVEPIQMALNDGSHFNYVPIKATLQALFKDENIDCYLQEFQSSFYVTDGCVLHDFVDGTACRNDPFFNEHPNALKLLLYQDEFEVVNPLGAARGKHKLLAVYYTIGNLHASVRSKIDCVQLVLLCNHTSLVSGPGIAEVLK
jgi:hypothetical protein